jgi:hypothetical protein
MKEMWEKLDVCLFESFERFAFDKKGVIYAIDITHAESYCQQGVTAMSNQAEQLTPLPIQVLMRLDLFS